MSLDDLKTAHFFNICGNALFHEFFSESLYPWDLLSKIGEFIKAIGPSLSSYEYEKIGDDIWISKEASISEFATIPYDYRSRCTAQTGFIYQGNAYALSTVVGTATEIKNSPARSRRGSALQLHRRQYPRLWRSYGGRLDHLESASR